MLNCRLLSKKVFLIFLLLFGLAQNNANKSAFGLGDCASAIKKAVYENRFWFGAAAALIGIKATKELFFNFRIIKKREMILPLAIVGAVWFVTDMITRMAPAQVQWYVSKRPDLPKELKNGQVQQENVQEIMPEVNVGAEKENKKLVTCVVCFDDKPESQVHKMSCCNTCFCKNCLRDHAQTQLKEGSLIGLRCPNTNCPHRNEQMNEQDLKAFLSDSVFEYVKDLKNYEERQAKFANGQGLDDKCYAHCPTPNCDAIFKRNKDENGEIICAEVQCPECHQRYCNRCLKKHSRLLSCNGAKSDDELETEKEKVKTVKKCPRCKSDIYKDGGCKHMHCSKCGFHFCWDCLGARPKVGDDPNYNGGYPHTSYYECTGTPRN